MSTDPTNDLSRLTGVRTGKNSYYPAFVRSSRRMQRTVRAMDRISSVVVRTVEGPRGVLEEVARAAAGHLEARWALLALGDEHLRGARPRFVAIGPGGASEDRPEGLPEEVAVELAAIRAGDLSVGALQDDWLRAPMNLEGRQIGVLSVRPGLGEDPEPEDLAVLRILANQAAVSLHTSEQYQASVTLHRRAQRLNRAAELQARDLAARTAELQAAEKQLAVAMQREIVGSERHRIARELHDSVTQYVLSAGMAVEVVRGDAEQHDLGPMVEQLARAKEFTQIAVAQLRTAIYALNQPPDEEAASLEELIEQVVAHHRPTLDVRVVAEGPVTDVPPAASQDLARSVGEALFNIAAHAGATRVIVRLRYRPSSLTVSIADDGCGDPTALRRMLRLEQRAVGDGRHRGLANMDDRIRSLGGTLTFRRARLGGLRVVLNLPLPVPTGRSASHPQEVS
ncbi:MadS family sensor histidine kinase [Flexivirga oryzae]|uniref:Signal transduction histidine kinase n=1 Tax=Flexivirga oryzae TaxID=1794944 RepID=A0A839N1E1_9MICO|nr:signal transduction histidine kinase [Flexivirga oryzae]